MAGRAVPKLSNTMINLLAYIRENGGKLVRYPGGYWAKEGWDRERPWYDTSTVQALVARDILVYTRWIETSTNKFPIEAQISASCEFEILFGGAAGPGKTEMERPEQQENV